MALQLLGAAMIAVPFILLIAWMSGCEGLRELAAIVCGSLVAVAWVLCGAWLLTGGR